MFPKLLREHSFYIIIINGEGNLRFKNFLKFKKLTFERLIYSILKFALKPKMSDTYHVSLFNSVFFFMYKNP